MSLCVFWERRKDSTFLLYSYDYIIEKSERKKAEIKKIARTQSTEMLILNIRQSKVNYNSMDHSLFYCEKKLKNIYASISCLGLTFQVVFSRSCFSLRSGVNKLTIKIAFPEKKLLKNLKFISKNLGNTSCVCVCVCERQTLL